MQPKVEPAAVKPTILGHAEFADYATKVADVFAGWRAAHLERLKSLKIGDQPKQLIEAISEDLLLRFSEVALVDKYDVYQHLMTYWAEVMQDDVHILAQDGWAAARQIRELARNSEGKFTEEPDLTIGKKKLKAELIPPPLIVARFFAEEQAALEKLEAAAEEAARAIEEMDEEHGGEEGLLAEAKTDKGNLTAKSVKDRLKEVKHDPDAADERKVLEQCLGLIEKEAEASRAAKEAKAALDTKTVAKYAKLTDAEVKALVVEDKWLARLEADVRGELDRVGQALTGARKTLDRALCRAAAEAGGRCGGAERQGRCAFEADGVQRMSAEEHVRPGYKQTEVGVIPEDWEVVPYRHISSTITVAASPSAEA